MPEDQRYVFGKGQYTGDGDYWFWAIFDTRSKKVALFGEVRGSYSDPMENARSTVSHLELLNGGNQHYHYYAWDTLDEEVTFEPVEIDSLNL